MEHLVERVLYEKMVKVAVVRGEVQTVETFCNKELLEQTLKDIVDRAYNKPIRSATIMIHIDGVSIPSIEYTFEEMVLPDFRKEVSEE